MYVGFVAVCYSSLICLTVGAFVISGGYGIVQHLYIAALENPDTLMSDSMVHILKNLKTFSMLNDKVMKKVCDRMKTETFVDGEYICRKGEVRIVAAVPHNE